MTLPRTTIQFIEPTETLDTTTAHKVKELRINGVPVAAEMKTLELEFSSQDVTKVRVTLLPTEVLFGPATPYSAPESAPSAGVLSDLKRRYAIMTGDIHVSDYQKGCAAGLGEAIERLEGTR